MRCVVYVSCLDVGCGKRLYDAEALWFSLKLNEKPSVTLSRRARAALILALLGVAISIVPTVLFLFVIENKRNDPLGWEIFADFPLHLLTAFIGAAIGFVGALLFRSAVRQEIEASKREQDVIEVSRRTV